MRHQTRAIGELRFEFAQASLKVCHLRPPGLFSSAASSNAVTRASMSSISIPLMALSKTHSAALRLLVTHPKEAARKPVPGGPPVLSGSRATRTLIQPERGPHAGALTDSSRETSLTAVSKARNYPPACLVRQNRTCRRLLPKYLHPRFGVLDQD